MANEVVVAVIAEAGAQTPPSPPDWDTAVITGFYFGRPADISGARHHDHWKNDSHRFGWSVCRWTSGCVGVSDESVMIKKRTRLPEPAIAIPFAELARLEIDKQNGMSAARIIGVGLSAGVGAILTVFAIVASIAD